MMLYSPHNCVSFPSLLDYTTGRGGNPGVPNIVGLLSGSSGGKVRQSNEREGGKDSREVHRNCKTVKREMYDINCESSRKRKDLGWWRCGKCSPLHFHVVVPVFGCLPCPRLR